MFGPWYFMIDYFTYVNSHHFTCVGHHQFYTCKSSKIYNSCKDRI